MLLHQDSPCMEYLPTYIITLSQMYVHIPYMEHLGHVIIIYNNLQYHRFSILINFLHGSPVNFQQSLPSIIKIKSKTTRFSKTKTTLQPNATLDASTLMAFFLLPVVAAVDPSTAIFGSQKSML